MPRFRFKGPFNRSVCHAIVPFKGPFNQSGCCAAVSLKGPFNQRARPRVAALKGPFSRTDVAGLVLAAGAGRRFGGPKAVVELGGVRLVDRAVRLLCAGGCAPVIVVSGALPLTVDDAVVVHNADWATGMGSSLRRGLVALPPRAGAVVVALVDQPYVGAEAVRRLIAAYAAGACAAVVTYNGKRRNPVLLARRTWADVITLAQGEAGARAYLDAHPEDVTLVPGDDTGDPADIDTPADLPPSRRAPIPVEGPLPGPAG